MVVRNAFNYEKLGCRNSVVSDRVGYEKLSCKRISRRNLDVQLCNDSNYGSILFFSWPRALV